jgi:hypothetical protein
MDSLRKWFPGDGLETREITDGRRNQAIGIPKFPAFLEPPDVLKEVWGLPPQPESRR